AFSSDGAKLAAACSSSVKLWDTATGADSGEWKLDPNEVPWQAECVAFSPNGKLLAAGGGGANWAGGVGGGNGILVFDATAAPGSPSKFKIAGGANCLAFSPDSTLLAAG